MYDTMLTLSESILVIVSSLGLGCIMTILLNKWLAIEDKEEECAGECNMHSDCWCGKPGNMIVNETPYCSWEHVKLKGNIPFDIKE